MNEQLNGWTNNYWIDEWIIMMMNKQWTERLKPNKRVMSNWIIIDMQLRG